MKLISQYCVKFYRNFKKEIDLNFHMLLEC